MRCETARALAFQREDRQVLLCGSKSQTESETMMLSVNLHLMEMTISRMSRMN